ncbi:hypothetical protein Tco_0703702 [Tanacetum coccineum]|uniref:Uncharacterized protein n=1 Tax=Tanacetum coccineum TaxID=301880 RepID=A0ABQ4Y138_9ASTR
MASSYECEAVIARQAWAHSKSRSQAMEAQIRALQRDVDVLQRQRIRDEDRLTTHIQHKHDKFRELVRTAEAGPQDGPADAGSSSILYGMLSIIELSCMIIDKMPPKKRTTTTTTTAPMTDAAIKALIAQEVVDALVKIKANRTSRNGDDSHILGIGSRRTDGLRRWSPYSILATAPSRARSSLLLALFLAVL